MDKSEHKMNCNYCGLCRECDKLKGITVQVKDPLKVSKGKKSRRDGMAFERKVRKDLEDKGWIVDKWTNNVDIELSRCGKYSDFPSILHPAKSFRGITRSNGFPDFIAFRINKEVYEVIAVEVKTKGILRKEEKEKCSWYLDNSVFSRIWIAYKG